MKIVTVCLITVILSGCGVFDQLRERIGEAEERMNQSTIAMLEAREKFDARQAVVDAMQTEMEIAISKGDFETATRLTASITEARIASAEANAFLRATEKNVDQKKDLVNAAKFEYDNAKSPWDYIMGGIVLIASLFGVGGTMKGISERQKRKIVEQNQLNPTRPAI